MPTPRPQDLRFLLIGFLPLLALLNVSFGGVAAALWTVGIWAVVAGVDAFWPGAQRSPPPADAPQGWLVGVLRVYAVLQIVLIGAGLLAARDARWLDVALLAGAVGFVTGAQGITFAHELGHSRSRLDRALAWLLMTSVAYPHFMVEHYRGHHPRAATHDDPASARRGESLWRFLPRTLAGSLRHAWQLESAQLRQLQRGWAASPLAWSSLAVLGVSAMLLAWGGARALAFWWLQSAVAVLLLETVNYIEHYGLQRAKLPGGQREPFAVGHAWNADHVVSNSLLANLQRHSDHHMHAWKPFDTLQALPGPQLPTGYAGCLLLAAVPPLWFALMHPRLEEWSACELGDAGVLSN